MAEKVCKHCRKKVTNNHSCSVAGRFVYYDNEGDFMTSFVVGNITEDPIIGTLVGGNALGAIMGASISEDSGRSRDHSDSSQNANNSDVSHDGGGSDPGSSSDSGGGCDGGGGGD